MIIAANHVIITDLEYSPESVLQAEDRAHRTGQQKEVNVYYLFSQGTIDEDMFDLISKKQAAISNAIDAKVSYTDVAKLLESASNIQLEVAKRLIAKKTSLTEVERAKPVATVSIIYQEPRNNFYEEWYQLKLEMEQKRMERRRKRKKKQLSVGTSEFTQLGLDFVRESYWKQFRFIKGRFWKEASLISSEQILTRFEIQTNSLLSNY